MARDKFSFRWGFVSTICLTLLAGLSTGCNDGKGPTTTTTTKEEAQPTAREILDRMVETYHKADTYADSGQLLFRFEREGGEAVREDADFSVTFARPNKLRMHFYQAIVVADGKDLKAAIGDLPNQILSVPAPATLTRDAVYGDPILASVLTRGIAGESIQLALLLLDKPLEGLLENGEEPTLLSPAQVEGEDCYRVQMKPNFGTVVFWIDQKSSVLRRVDFPAENARTRLAEQGVDKIGNVTLMAEFKGARLNAKIEPEAFQVALPEGAKLVDQLIYQPKLLGQQAPDFKLTTLDGTTLSRDSLKGKVVVVDFWATWCDWCLKGMPNLEQVHQKYKDNDQVVIVAVSTDDAQKTDDELRATFAKAKVNIPIARDTDQKLQTAFEVQGLPSMFVIGADGVVQHVETEYNAELANQLPAKLDKLLAGESVFETALEENEKRQRELRAAAEDRETTQK